jgi:hypothetical protein
MIDIKTVAVRRLHLFTLFAASIGWSQTQQPGPGRQIGSGAADIGKGAGKATGHLAKGTAVGVVHLVTLHPIDAGASFGRGALSAGKDVGVGTVKGTGKMAKGIGRGIKKLF